MCRVSTFLFGHVSFPLRPCTFQRGSDVTGIGSPYAWLSMEVAQVTDSLEEITEIDPLNIAEILGNIGGFWGESRDQQKGRIVAGGLMAISKACFAPHNVVFGLTSPVNDDSTALQLIVAKQKCKNILFIISILF